VPHRRADGTAVTLTATPDAGSTFTGFSGADCSGATCTIAMSSPRLVAARFTRSTSSGTTAPQTRITRIPATLANVHSRFAFASDEAGSSFQCSTDPADNSDPTAARHRFRVRAAAGCRRPIASAA
jgi:hypothetical protein